MISRSDGVQDDTGVGSEVVGDRGGLADPDVDVGPVGDVPGDGLRQLVAAQRSAIKVLDRVVDGDGDAHGRSRVTWTMRST